MKKLFALAALLTLTGCQPPTYDIVVKRIGGAIVISGQGDESWQFGWKNDTINAGMVSIYDREGHGWSIYMSGGPGCDPGSKTAPFPLTYGKLPRCFSEKKPADPIQPGVAYKVEAGAALRAGQGAFRLEPSGAITTLSATAMGVNGEEWPPEANPSYLNPADLNGTFPDNSVDNAL
jgi:hypothetical protein